VLSPDALSGSRNGKASDPRSTSAQPTRISLRKRFTLYIREIWRFPVKSMRGERIPFSDVALTGLASDRRIVCVSYARRSLVTARTNPGLLGLQGKVEEGEITINGEPWQSRSAQELASAAGGEEVVLVDLGTNEQRFDVLPLLVATDGAIAALEMDSRRFRPNIIIGGVAGTLEREWPGSELQLGDVRIRAAQLRRRCVMTTFDPDSLDQDLSILRKIVTQNRGTLALDCSVVQGGALREGDLVTIYTPAHHDSD